MNVTERLQTLVETAKDILNVYHENMGNKNISLTLRQALGDNIMTLEAMINDAENLSLFDQNESSIIQLSEDLFVVFNTCVIKNIKIFNYLFETA